MTFVLISAVDDEPGLESTSVIMVADTPEALQDEVRQILEDDGEDGDSIEWVERRRQFLFGGDVEVRLEFADRGITYEIREV